MLGCHGVGAATSSMIRPSRDASKILAASTKAATPVGNTAAEAAAHAAETASAVHATTATARRHNVGCKHCKCYSRQQRDRDFTEHD
jgi:hypothetical protein